MPLELNTLLAERYLVQRLLAQGGTADVYGVFDTNLQVHRVVKVAARPNPTTAARWLRNEQAFLEGVRSPHFPACFDWIDDPSALVLEYCDGVPLSDVPLDSHPATAVGVCRRVADLLLACHAQGFVYRDLKPSNVIVPPDPGRPWWLVDFGAVCRIGAASEAIGTEGFAAPEVVGGSSVDASSDVYSLGRCLSWLAERSSAKESALLSGLTSGLADEDPARRPSSKQILGLLDDAWTVEAWSAPGARCPACFQPVSQAPTGKDCACPGPSLDLRSARAAAERLSAWATDAGRRDHGLAAWLLQRVNGLDGLSDGHRLHLARWHQRAGRAAEALQVVSPRASTAPPAPSLAPLQLRLTYEVKGHESALAQIHRWTSALSGNVHWARSAAQVLAKHGRAGEATDVLRAALRAHPSDGPCHALLAQLLAPGAERDDHARKAASGDPPDPDSVRRVAQGLLGADRGRERAIAVAREALAKAPSVVALKRLVADLSIVEPRCWPSLEVDLRGWVATDHDDTLLEYLVDLYVRSERWAQLLGPKLPHGSSPATRALIQLARAVARRDGLLEGLDDLRWELSQPARWLSAISEALMAATKGRKGGVARQWLRRLPSSFAPFLDDLQRLVTDAR